MISCWNNFMFLVIVIPDKPPFKSKFESKATVLYCKPSLKYRNELMVLNLATDWLNGLSIYKESIERGRTIYIKEIICSSNCIQQFSVSNISRISIFVIGNVLRIFHSLLEIFLPGQYSVSFRKFKEEHSLFYLIDVKMMNWAN